jgi:hypothetical protein
MKALALFLAAATTLVAGCLLDIDYDGTRFSCNDGVCPDGFACVDGTCVASAAGQDGGAGGDATGQADAGAADSGPLLTCDEQFGAAPSYTLCLEEATTCEFFVTADVASACTDICLQYDATCVNSYDATGGGTECTRELEGACTATHQSQICICDRGEPPA